MKKKLWFALGKSSLSGIYFQRAKKVLCKFWRKTTNPNTVPTWKFLLSPMSRISSANRIFIAKLLLSQHWETLLFLFQEEFGHLVLLALFDCVDDTVLVKKIMFSVRFTLFCLGECSHWSSEAVLVLCIPFLQLTVIIVDTGEWLWSPANKGANKYIFYYLGWKDVLFCAHTLYMNYLNQNLSFA